MWLRYVGAAPHTLGLLPHLRGPCVSSAWPVIEVWWGREAFAHLTVLGGKLMREKKDCHIR